MTPPPVNIARRIALATITIMVSFGLSKVVGFVKEIIVARSFGTGWQYDAYAAAFEVPEQIFVIISAGALGMAFIPVYGGFLAHHDRRDADQLASSILTLAFLIGMALATFIGLFAEPLVSATVARGFDEARRQLTVELMRIILIGFVLFAVSGVLHGILNAHHHFLLPAIAPAMYNLGIILGAVFLAPRLGIHGLAWGVVLGAALHLSIQLPGLFHFRLRYRPILGLRLDSVRQVAVLMAPRVVSLGLFELNTLVNASLASSLVVGSVAALGYGWRLMQLPETIFATAIATAAFPTLAELASKQQFGSLRDTMSGALRTIFFLTIPTAVGMIVLAQPLVAAVFQRGAFDANSTTLVAWSLQFWALGLVAHSALEIVARTFYAMKDAYTPFFVAAAALIGNLLLALVLREPLGVGGLALANSIAFTLQVSVLLWLLRHKLGGIDGARLFGTLGKISLAALVMGAAVIAVATLLEDQRPIIVAGAGVAVGGLVYATMVFLLRVEEARLLPRMVMRRFSRREVVESGD